MQVQEAHKRQDLTCWFLLSAIHEAFLRYEGKLSTPTVTSGDQSDPCHSTPWHHRKPSECTNLACTTCALRQSWSFGPRVDVAFSWAQAQLQEGYPCPYLRQRRLLCSRSFQLYKVLSRHRRSQPTLHSVVVRQQRLWPALHRHGSYPGFGVEISGVLCGAIRAGARMFFGIFCFFVFFVLFLAIWKHPPTICCHLAAARRCVASRTTVSGQIMGARQSLALSDFRASGF